jgi:mono/diheme cytochrome c family protein
VKCLGAVIIIILLIIGGFLAYIYSGAYSVAATKQNPGWIDWIVRTTRSHSISARLDQIKVPNDLHTARRIAVGAKHYAAMCAVCHLAPGVKSSETRAGLNPRPPNLPKIAGHLEPKATYWFIKNGVRMTAMPAWGVTHSKEKLWDIVAFVEALPGMSAKRYQALSAGGEEAHQHHVHRAREQQRPMMPAPGTMQRPQAG